jgi:hypothetical protein
MLGYRRTLLVTGTTVSSRELPIGHILLLD